MQSCQRGTSTSTLCLCLSFYLVFLTIQGLIFFFFFVLFGVFYHLEPLHCSFISPFSTYHFIFYVADGNPQQQQQQPQQQDPAQQLLGLIQQLHQRLNPIENQPQQPAPAPQGQQQLQQPLRQQQLYNRSAAADFGSSPEQVSSSFRELQDRLRAVPIPASTSVNTTKPHGASSAAKAELDNINVAELDQANLIIGLHLISILQLRQGDLFVEATFPDSFDTFRALRAGPAGEVFV